MRLPPLYAEYRMPTCHEMQYALAAVAQAIARPPTAPRTATRDTTLPHAARIGARRIAIRLDCTLTSRHPMRTPGSHTLRPHARLPTAPRTATRATTVPHAARIGARRIGARCIAIRLDCTLTSRHPMRTPGSLTPRTHAPHRAPHSYPRHDGATCRTDRRTPYRHTLRPHARPPTAPRTATHATTLPHAARIGARCIAARCDCATGAARPAVRDAHSSGASWAAVARQLLPMRRWWPCGFGTRRVRKSSGPRRAAAEHVTANRVLGAVHAVAEVRHNRPRETAICRTRYLSPAPRCRSCGRRAQVRFTSVA